MNDIVKAVFTFILIILSTISIQCTFVRLYNSWCSPSTLFGFVQTIFTLGSPLCHFINYVQFELEKHYIGLWAGAAIAIITYITAQLSAK
jgi:hypothetical protein